MTRWMLAIGFALAALMFTVFGSVKTFGVWGLRQSTPDYVDARTITTAAESIRAGFDPMSENPCYSEGTLLNYPRIWQSLEFTGIDEKDTWLLALIFALLFVVGILILPVEGLSHREGILMCLIVFSPASCLALLRGNNDLVVFALVAAGCRFMPLRRGEIWSTILLFGAFVLKLFPVFAFAALVRWSGRNLALVGGGVFLALLGYTWISWGDLHLIAAGTPRATGLSYGTKVLWMELTQHSGILGAIARGISYCGMVLAFGLLVLGGRQRVSDSTVSADEEEPEIDAFRAGAGVFLGTFLLGNNWDYRLIFLILMVPQLVKWAKISQRWLRLISRCVLAGVVLSMWHIVFHLAFSSIQGGSPASVLLDEVANWSIFFGCAWLIARTLPISFVSLFERARTVCRMRGMQQD